MIINMVNKISGGGGGGGFGNWEDVTDQFEFAFDRGTAGASLDEYFVLLNESDYGTMVLFYIRANETFTNNGIHIRPPADLYPFFGENVDIAMYSDDVENEYSGNVMTTWNWQPDDCEFYADYEGPFVWTGAYRVS